MAAASTTRRCLSHQPPSRNPSFLLPPSEAAGGDLHPTSLRPRSRPPPPRRPLQDWELFSKCVLAGYRLEAVPDPLYWYRLRDTSHSRVTATHSNNMRTIRPYLKIIPESMHHLVMFAQARRDKAPPSPPCPSPLSPLRLLPVRFRPPPCSARQHLSPPPSLGFLSSPCHVPPSLPLRPFPLSPPHPNIPVRPRRG